MAVKEAVVKYRDMDKKVAVVLEDLKNTINQYSDEKFRMIYVEQRAPRPTDGEDGSLWIQLI